MARRSHIHKYIQLKLPGGFVWSCALPDCNHHMPRHLAAKVNGKESLCNVCGEKFIMTPITMDMPRPQCESCRSGTKVVEAPISESLKAAIKDDRGRIRDVNDDFINSILNG